MSILRYEAKKTTCPVCGARPLEPCKYEFPNPLGAYHYDRYKAAKERSLKMASQTQRELLEVGLLTQTEAESPITDIGAILRALVRLVSTVSDLEKQVREIRNQV